ncbi:alpha/beta-hydrolase [Wolfiporia cocos MD-104 SS10]|uniref:Alpha/beta-hydrolase n=1 Tax=Wolfiporia cocos (strain MD-104) TaxID=742152 RepID=A0A2H3JPK2_WOLCO|nr:alpha/beta-hydrolase [Wolfiporia cocos MD-104 SS10]
MRYWLLGPEKGTKVVLVHGLNTPSVTWINIAPALASRGYRVLVYDLYGKGYSQAPKTTYHVNLFVTQLALLLQYLHWDNAHVAGFSMGGGITAAFAAVLPHLVAGKIILMASAGASDPGPEKPASAAAAPVPQFGELIDLQAELLPGYTAAVQSCLQDGPIHDLLWAFDKIAITRVGSGQEVQVLIIHGTDDYLVRYSDSLEINRRIPSARLVTVEGAGHDFTARDGHWQQVADAMLEFLDA